MTSRRPKSCSLAIETSSRSGSIALGRAGRLIEHAPVPAPIRHDLELMPTLATLCECHGVRPDDLGRLYISIGPGSFTGLRMGIATARMLARATGAKLVAVPTLDVLVQNALADPTSPRFAAACVMLRPDRVYARLYERSGESLMPLAEPDQRSLVDFLLDWPDGTRLYGAPLPEIPPEYACRAIPAGSPYDVPHAEALWCLGELQAAQGRYTDPAALVPLYVRPPDAVEVWDAKDAAAAVRLA